MIDSRLHRLLADDGSLWVIIDDNEGHYLKVLCDEIFGRECFVSTVIWRSTDNSNNDAKTFSVDHNMILVYARTPGWRSFKLQSSEEQQSHFKNPDNDPRGPWFDGDPLSSPSPRPKLRYSITSPKGLVIKPPANGWRWGKREHQREGLGLVRTAFTPAGKGSGDELPGRNDWPPSLHAVDGLEVTGHNRQLQKREARAVPHSIKEEWFPTPKPERLLKESSTWHDTTGDWVLDSFAGSGTTGAVAHKMGRRWIMVELGEHCHTHIIPRLKKVIDGEDPGGITEAVGWKGGGGFRYYRLAPSLLEKDKWGNWVISKEYNAAMLAEALCKLEGFTYAPSDTVYWQHGHSTERDFIYVTTQTSQPRATPAALSDEVGAGAIAAGPLHRLPRQGRSLPEPHRQEDPEGTSCRAASGATTTTA